jgi:hypothetical protein
MPKWTKLDPQHIYAKLLNVKVTPFGVNPKGELRDAYIRALGRMVRGSIEIPVGHKPSLRPDVAEGPVYFRREANYEINPDGMVWLDVTPELCKPVIFQRDQVSCLHLGKGASQADNYLVWNADVSMCLRVIGREDGEAVFERIGIGIHYDGLDPMETAQVCSVKIV